MSKLPHWAVKGAQVVCIWDQPWLNTRRERLHPFFVPKFMQTYTIAETKEDDRQGWITLTEIPKIWFYVKGFRPPVRLEKEQEVVVHINGDPTDNRIENIERIHV